MADILRTLICCIVSAFHDEMLNSSKSGLLEKDWIVMSKPLMGPTSCFCKKFSSLKENVIYINSLANWTEVLIYTQQLNG
ncbi:hypothetical protein LguiB_022091 [Lonicera macranthoides]